MSAGGRQRSAPPARVLAIVAAALLLASGAPATALAAAPAAAHPAPGRAELDRRALQRIERPPLGLPPVPVPAGNRATTAKIRLGRKLFLDRRLSRNGTLSCAMCHIPEQGFTGNETRTAVGFEGTTLRRNAPTLLNAAYAAPYFHDGREPDLETQPFDVFLNPDEMAAPSLGAVVSTVSALPDYAPLFETAFGGRPSVERIGQAIATYVRTLLSADSPFDRWRYGGERDAVSPAARRGYDLFTGLARCSACHAIGKHAALLSDYRFHDTGVAWYESVVLAASREPVDVGLVPGVTARVPRTALETVGAPPDPDLGRYEVTGDPADRWLIKTPTLRNVALTAPYMHDGSFSTLREVVEYYNHGARPHEGLDPILGALGMAGRDVDDLVALLESFTGDGVEALVRDARSESVGNPGAD